MFIQGVNIFIPSILISLPHGGAKLGVAPWPPNMNGDGLFVILMCNGILGSKKGRPASIGFMAKGAAAGTALSIGEVMEAG